MEGGGALRHKGDGPDCRGGDAGLEEWASRVYMLLVVCKTPGRGFGAVEQVANDRER